MSFLSRLSLSLTILVIVSASVLSGKASEEKGKLFLNDGGQDTGIAPFGSGDYIFLYGSKAYHIHIKPLNWFGAWNYCKTANHTLAIIEDGNEHKVLTEYIKNIADLKYFWIGAHNYDTFDKEKYMWVEKAQVVKNYRWCDGEPNNGEGEQHCIRLDLYKNNCWDDYDCSGALNFVCETTLI